MYRRNVEDYYEMATPHIQLVTQYPNSSTWKYETDVFWYINGARSLVYNCIM